MDVLPASLRREVDLRRVPKETKLPPRDNKQTKLQRLMDRLTTLLVQETARQGKRVAKRQAEDEVLAYLEKKRNKKDRDRLSAAELARRKSDPVAQYSLGFAHGRDVIASFVSKCTTGRKRVCARLVEHLNTSLLQVPLFAEEQQGKHSPQQRQQADGPILPVSKGTMAPLARLFSVLSIMEDPSKRELKKKERKRKEYRRKREEWAWMETVTDVSAFS